MKKAYYITGIGASGKSVYAKKIAAMLGGVQVYNIDNIYSMVIKKLGVDKEHRILVGDKKAWEDPAYIGLKDYAPYKSYAECIQACYKELFSGKCDTIVFEGEAALLRDTEWDIMRDELDGYALRVFLINPDYTQWLKNRTLRLREQKENPNAFYPKFRDVDQYAAYQDFLRMLIHKKGFSHFEINRDSQLGLEMTVLGYQFPDFSDPKWPLFKFPKDMKGKSFMDIGCNAGWFLNKAHEQGAEVYGVDIDWHLLDLALDRVPSAKVSMKKIEDFNTDKKFDYILCSSALHFFTDHQRVLDKISALTGEYFILEVPLLEDKGDDLIFDDFLRSAVPTRQLLMRWLNNSFKKVEEIGTTDQWQPNNTPRKKRIVFKCSN